MCNIQLNPNDFDTGNGSFDTDETRVFARLAEAGHPVPPPLLSYAVDSTLPATPGRSFTERVSLKSTFFFGRGVGSVFFFFVSSGSFVFLWGLVVLVLLLVVVVVVSLS